ncbi:MAG: MATE family efflux transporter [Lachnospiraceae bacterium]|nr:MATE family efflux transporter [bacterium]MDY5516704.1 MATE family efflux transporter [Lachnospiraceae bacterium]
MNVRKQFAKYVSQNIFGMIGISLYILADTFFISQAVGADGITALNLVLPLYSVIFAIGQMIGVGSAIRFAVEKGQNRSRKYPWFSNALIWTTILGTVFMVTGFLFPEQLVALMGGDASIVAVGAPYTRIFMSFSIFFMWNHVCNAFVRNDGAPTVAMAATLFSSLFNIVFDYVLMYPLHMGMEGAALATACSPIVGVLICLVHILSKKSTLRFHFVKPDVGRLCQACQLGVSAFVGEMSSGVTTMAFNYLILDLAGNTGVAAYGVVANLAIVAVAMFNGIAQGSQPLISDYYGRNERSLIRRVIRMGLWLSLLFAVLIVFIVWRFAAPITAVFNKADDPALAAYAQSGLRLYMTGFFFAGWNIVGTSVLSAMEQARAAFAASMLRGFVLILLCAFAMAALFGMTGVWLAYPAAEALTLVVTFTGLWKALRVGTEQGT